MVGVRRACMRVLLIGRDFLALARMIVLWVNMVMVDMGVVVVMVMVMVMVMVVVMAMFVTAQ
jgi:hypothetical protein